jgi:propionyl-CoA carboxylase beta chain
MGAQGAVEILYARELREHPTPEVIRSDFEAQYTREFLSPMRAAQRGYIDEVIEPSETRRKLYRYLTAIRNKQTIRPARNNGNIPL